MSPGFSFPIRIMAMLHTQTGRKAGSGKSKMAVSNLEILISYLEMPTTTLIFSGSGDTNVD